MTEVHGTVAPGFELVREAFARNFTEGGDVGAAVCVYRHGEKIVDLWGGLADAESGRPWTRDTLQLAYSTTKGAAAITVHRLIERGLLELDAPVARYWPEFAAEGKQDVTVRWLLSHRAGLAALDEKVPLAECADQDKVAARLAAQKPLWEPGTEHGYHTVTFGWLVAELVRRVTGRPFGEVFRSEVAEPVGAEVWVGLPEELEPRVATVILPKFGAAPEIPEGLPAPIRKLMADMADPNSLMMRSMVATEPPLAANSRFMREIELPSANGVGTAEGFARLYAATVGELDGVRLLAPETVELARATQVAGPDKVLVLPARWGLGFIPQGQAFGEMVMLGPGSFGHGGFGGSMAFGDVEHGIGFGYLMNHVQSGMTGDGGCAGRLIGALRTALNQQAALNQ